MFTKQKQLKIFMHINVKWTIFVAKTYFCGMSTSSWHLYSVDCGLHQLSYVFSFYCFAYSLKQGVGELGIGQWSKKQIGYRDAADTWFWYCILYILGRLASLKLLIEIVLAPVSIMHAFWIIFIRIRINAICCNHCS